MTRKFAWPKNSPCGRIGSFGLPRRRPGRSPLGRGQGRPNFIEVNPLPGLNPIDSDLPILCRQAGISYVELIERIVASARQRII